MNIKKNFVFLIISLLMTFLLPNYANAALVFTFEAAGEQNSTVPANQVNVETFNNLTVGTKTGNAAIYSSAIGSFFGSYKISDANNVLRNGSWEGDGRWGGAGGAGTPQNPSRYITSTDATLSFTNAIGYFGLWWSAGDTGNQLVITTVANGSYTYTTETLRNLLNGKTAYFGNPNPPFPTTGNPMRRVNGEPFAFLNFFATDEASKITSINLKTLTGSGGFESDNYTTAANLQTITGTMVPGTCSAPQIAGTYPYCSCPDNKVLDAAGTTCITPVVTCTAPQILDSTTNTCKTANPSCEALTRTLPSPMPAGAEYDSKKVTICHFPPGNPGNVHTISISLNALDAHVGKHGDTIWQSGKNCPKLPSDCQPPVVSTPAYPTVDSQTTKNTKPTITGTIGTTPLAGDGTFSVKVPAVGGTTYSCVYNKPGNGKAKLKTSCTNLNIDDTVWTLTPTTALAVGTHDVLATREEKQGSTSTVITTTDKTTDELTIILDKCPTGQGFVNNVCIDLPLATVNTQTTTVTTPLIITGTVGNSALGASEGFAVGVNGKTYIFPNGDGNLKVTGLNWTLQIPDANAIPAGLYDVAVTRDNGLPDTTENELRIDDTPTIVSQTTFITKPTITGTVGKTALGTTEAFSVTVNGVIYPKTSLNFPSPLTWTLNISTALPVGTYNVDVLRNGVVPDATSGELIIQPLVYPTVDNNKTTTDQVAVQLSGTAGTSTSLIITIKNASNVVVATSSSITPTANVWTYTPPVLPAGTYNVIATGDTGLVDTSSGELVISASVPPTVDAKSTTEGTPVPLTGQPGSSLTILSVTLTKFEDGLGAAVIDLPVSVGSNITSGQTIWTTSIPSTMKEAVGKYTITATDGNNKTGTNTLIVTCATGKMATASSCITVTNPTVNDKSTPDSVPVTLDGNIGTSTTISSVTLTKTKDGLGAAVSGVTATPVAGTPLSISSGTTWSISSGAVSVGTYTITVTDNYSKTATGTLTVTCATGKIATSTACNAPQPTVEPQTTFDTTPIIKGTVGTSALETNEAFTVAVNGKTYTNGVDANLVVSTLAWTLTIQAGSEIQGSATPYSVVATRGTAPNATTGTGNLTITPCTLPNVVNDSVTPATCSLPVPTVSSAAWNSNVTARVIHGTIGEVALGSTETFSVTIKSTPSHIYNHAKPETDLKITGMNWTLTIPAADAILAGTYDVEVARNGTAKDTTLNELTITLVCDLPQVKVSNACVTPVSPTVNTATTTDKVAPTLAGTVGSSSSLTITIQDSTGVKATGAATITAAGNWTFTPSAPIAKGTYDVVAEGETGLKNSPPGELTVTMECTLPQVANAAGTACINSVPTVTPLNTPDKKPTLSGTIGTTPLTNNETFSVSVNGTTYTNGDGNLSVSGTDWTLLITTELKPETYDVDAVRQGTHDETSGELVINDDIEVCEISTTQTKFIIRSQFDPTKYYLGKCNMPPCARDPNGKIIETADCTPDPDPDKDPVDCTKTDAATLAKIADGTLVCILPTQPGSLVDEAIAYTDPNGVNYCVANTISGGSACNPTTDAGCVVTGQETKSQATVTIKRARIANSTTEGGQVCLYNTVNCPTDQPPPLVKYGELTDPGTMDITNATINKGVATNVNLTKATISGAFIDTFNDYISSNGSTSATGNWIVVKGGKTLKTPTEAGTPSAKKAIVTSGVITSGEDSQGNPIRGSITNAVYDMDVANAPAILTKGRRVQGAVVNGTPTQLIVVNATITGARTTTVAGKTVVDSGTLVSGDIQSGSTPSTYGTVLNTTVTATTITQSASQCSTGGSITGVGSRGQLMWKEIIRKK